MKQTTTAVPTAELAQLSELIDNIYQGATNPAHWDGVLPRIAEWVGAERGLLFTALNTPERGGFYFNHAIPEHAMQLWETRYQPHDIWANRVVEHGLFCEGNTIIGDQVVPFEELSRSEFYQGLLSKINIAHVLTGVVFGLENPELNPVVVCALFRSREAGSFISVERDRLAILVPHLSRSLGVMTRLRNVELKAAASLAALDRLMTGVVLFDAHRAVSFANRAAQRVLQEEDGIRLRHLAGNSALGEIIALDRNTQEALSSAISGAVAPDPLHTAHFSRAVTVMRPSGRQAYTLNFSSLAAHNEFGSGSAAPRAIAFITDSAEPVRLDAELMKTSYGLTPAEIRVAEMLAECLTVDETAERMVISRSTVKAHQARIYEKTNTNSRAKLMKLLVSLAQVG